VFCSRRTATNLNSLNVAVAAGSVVVVVVAVVEMPPPLVLGTAEDT